MDSIATYQGCCSLGFMLKDVEVFHKCFTGSYAFTQEMMSWSSFESVWSILDLLVLQLCGFKDTMMILQTFQVGC